MIKQINLGDIPGRTTTPFCKVQKEVMEFYESGWDAAEVDITEYKNPNAARASFDAAVKRCRVGVKPMIRQGRLFLIRDKG